jgi:hypothetical protein
MSRGDPGQHLRSLLGNFRLLEAAGACDAIAQSWTEDCSPARAPAWWHAVADAARGYRAAIYGALLHGFSAIEDWSGSALEGPDEVAAERRRLRREHRVWFCDVPGGTAYEAWLSAYVAVAELDGHRALQGLDRCAAVMREFVDVAGLGCEPSVYQTFQNTADALAGFLPLPQHPLRDAARFSFLPTALRVG